MSGMTLRPRFTALALGLLLIPAARAQQTVLPLWPHGTPEPAQTTAPEADVTKDSDNLINGHRSIRLANVTKPTMSVYSPAADKNTGAAALVFPGGGYSRLAWTGEGTDVCDWLNSVGMTCLLVKYRVPQPSGAAGRYPADPADLEDAQQAMRLARNHAAEWHIDPTRIGVIGFSAGANLAVLMSTHPDDHHVESTPAAADIPHIASESTGAIRINALPDARPNFAIVVYPAYLALPPEETTIDPTYAPNQFTPPTFLIQAENDKNYIHSSLVYYRALLDAKIPAELHIYPTGGHGFGVHPPNAPEEHWTHLANEWLRSINVINVLPSSEPRHQSRPANLVPLPAPIPCPAPQPPPPGQQPQSTPPANATNSNPNCLQP
jgi:acetyl esterase/lipase